MPRRVDIESVLVIGSGPNPTQEDSPMKRPTKEGLLRRNQQNANAQRSPRLFHGRTE
jgi:hypothetical protein